MGTFFRPITLIGPNGHETLGALVDTDSMFARFPATILEGLGVQPLDRRRFHGSFVGQAEAFLRGQQAHIMVLFGAEGDQPVIGRHTLDSFLLDVDEKSGKLVAKILLIIEHAY